VSEGPKGWKWTADRVIVFGAVFVLLTVILGAQLLIITSQTSNSDLARLQLREDRFQIQNLKIELANPTLGIWSEPVLCPPSSIQGCAFIQTVPDTFDYNDTWTSPSPVTVYFIDAISFAACGPVLGSFNSTSWRTCIGSKAAHQFTSTQGRDVFTDGEGCAAYLVVYSASANQEILPNVSVKYNPATAPTGVCAEQGYDFVP
jgi:hypothetical protein